MYEPTLASLNISIFIFSGEIIMYSIPFYYVQIKYYYIDTIFLNKHGWFYTSFNLIIILWTKKYIKFILKHHSIYYFQGR